MHDPGYQLQSQIESNKDRAIEKIFCQYILFFIQFCHQKCQNRKENKIQVFQIFWQ